MHSHMLSNKPMIKTVDLKFLHDIIICCKEDRRQANIQSDLRESEHACKNVRMHKSTDKPPCDQKSIYANPHKIHNSSDLCQK